MGAGVLNRCRQSEEIKRFEDLVRLKNDEKQPLDARTRECLVEVPMNSKLEELTADH
jgi:hypothetical protein